MKCEPLTDSLPREIEDHPTARRRASRAPAVAGAREDLCLMLKPLCIQVPLTAGDTEGCIYSDFKNTTNPQSLEQVALTKCYVVV